MLAKMLNQERNKSRTIVDDFVKAKGIAGAG
jgi:hypothetical protein